MASQLWDLPDGLTRDKVQSVFYAIAKLYPQQGLSSLENKQLDTEDYEDEHSDNVTVTTFDIGYPESNRAYNNKSKLRDRFLNRVAEVMSPQKHNPGRRDGNRTAIGSDADHITASVLVTRGLESNVLVAKNGGFERADIVFCSLLQEWLRDIATTGREPQPERCLFLRRLLFYNSDRIRYHVKQINEHASKEQLELPRSAKSLYNGFLNACRNCSPTFFHEEHGTIWEIVKAAHLLRSKITQAQSQTTIARNVALLGRLLACYKTFIDFALTSASCMDIQIIPLDAPAIEVFRNSTMLEQLQMMASTEAIAHEDITDLRKICRKSKYQGFQAYVHAEMQLVIQYALMSNQGWTFYDYMGGSRFPCYFCSLMLKHHDHFRTRETHGTAPSSWTLSLPPSDAAAQSLLMLGVRNALIDTYQEVLANLTHTNHCSPHVADLASYSSSSDYLRASTATPTDPTIKTSSSGSHDNTGVTPQFSTPRPQSPVDISSSSYGDGARLFESSRKRLSTATPWVGKACGTRKVLCLPSGSRKPKLIDLPINEHVRYPMGSRTSHLLDVSTSCVSRSSRSPATLYIASWLWLTVPSGTFMVYWMQDAEQTSSSRCCDNEFAIDVLESSGEIVEADRHFWQGDILIAHVKETIDASGPTYHYFDMIIPASEYGLSDSYDRSNMAWTHDLLLHLWRTRALENCCEKLERLAPEKTTEPFAAACRGIIIRSGSMTLFSTLDSSVMSDDQKKRGRKTEQSSDETGDWLDARSSDEEQDTNELQHEIQAFFANEEDFDDQVHGAQSGSGDSSENEIACEGASERLDSMSFSKM